MPDLGILFNSPPLPLPLTPTLKPVSDQRDSSSPLTPKPVKTLVIEGDCDLPLPVSNGNEVRVLRKTRGGGKMTVENNNKCLDDFGKAWVENKVESGVAERKCFLPFLVGAPRLGFHAEVNFMNVVVKLGLVDSRSVKIEIVMLSVGFANCQSILGRKCYAPLMVVKLFSTHHACYLCKQKSFWRCVRCMVASHDKCAAFPEGVIHLNNQPGRAVCWRHPEDWRLEKIEYVLFSPILLSLTELDVYLIKKKRNDVDGDIGCTNCNSTQCSEDCVCRNMLPFGNGMQPSLLPNVGPLFPLERDLRDPRCLAGDAGDVNGACHYLLTHEEEYSMIAEHLKGKEKQKRWEIIKLIWLRMLQAAAHVTCHCLCNRQATGHSLCNRQATGHRLGHRLFDRQAIGDHPGHRLCNRQATGDRV
ncbi:hypothetical protein RHGRI_000174 [Rhododendron griersonianum]|uniref:Histone-lysine N-methyltransferase ASHR3 n=1 Tax=Rhododendron griersonianum TaxID=479676 RepID=A0AAV6LFH8_9ERIC|nr:hypothetical protein RHGRI_000174 [Rhododendron griersonianum]